MNALLHDIRYAIRILVKSPGFTAVAILTLALGIGANTAIFSIVNAVLLRPLPFKNPSRLVMLWESFPALHRFNFGDSAPDLTLYEREQQSFEFMGSFQNKTFDLSGGRGEPERVIAARTSASIFPLLGVQPLLGRVYTNAEDKPGDNVAVISYGLWQRRYGSDRGIVGRTIDLDRVPYTVLGVMPRTFEFPLPGPSIGNQPADIWVPMAFTPTELQGFGNMFNNSVLARLKPGVTMAQAQSEANRIADDIQRAYPAALVKNFPNLHVHLTVDSFAGEITGPVKPVLLVLMAAVGFVLLIVCANLATLLLSRASGRQKEIAIRTALGATRLRLVRQVLTESLVLAFAGGALGLLVAYWATSLLLSLVPPELPLSRGAAMNGSVLLFVLGACCLTAILFGAAPALQISGGSLQSSLQEGGRSGTAGRARHRLQGFFVASEFALAVVLLAGAGLLLRSFGKLLETNPGFRPDHVLTMNVPLPYEAYPKAAQIRQFYEQALARISNLPGVKSSGVSNDLPLKGQENDVIRVEGKADSTPLVTVTWVLSNYLESMGIPLLRGRAFTPEDREKTQPVTLVSAGAAEAFWPGQNPIGKRINWGNSVWMTVVGEVGDVKDASLKDKASPHIYIPYLQLADNFTEDNIGGEGRSMNIAVRTAADPASLGGAITSQIHSLDRDLAIAHIRTMDQEISASIAGPKFNTSLLGVFAVAALLLAAIGVYGVLSYLVGQRTHEIGIRLALGAQRGDVLKLVLGQAARTALIGVAIGIVAALVLTRLMSTLLYGVSANDPLTFIVAAVVLCAVALAACYIPARRAMRVDPMVALRYE